MITYRSGGAFGCNILFRLHGSAVFKSCTPAILSSIIYVLLFEFTDISPDNKLMDHPYPMGALIAAFSFLLIFRANFSYNRYWEAHSSIHAMHAKWLDVATELAAFHLQSACYQSVRPPSFGAHAQELHDVGDRDPTAAARYSSDDVSSSKRTLTAATTTATSTAAAMFTPGGTTAAMTGNTPTRRNQHNAMTPQQLEHQIDAQIEHDEQTHPSLRTRLQKRMSSKFNLFGNGGKSNNNNKNKHKSKHKSKRNLNEDNADSHHSEVSSVSSDRGDSKTSSKRDDDDTAAQNLFTKNSNSDSDKEDKNDRQAEALAAQKKQQYLSSLRSSARNRHRSGGRTKTTDSEQRSSKAVHFGSTPMPGGPRNVIPLQAVKEEEGHTVKQSKLKKKKKQKERRANDFFDPRDNTPYSSFWRHARHRLEEGHMNPKQVPVPYFLETVGHILSLLSAVALSTLRNDLEEAESPLAEFRPNAPWPHVDPDMYQGDIRKGWYQSEHRTYTVLRYLLGLSRTDNSRIRYNTGRPFRVIGNVSDDEIQALQAARGPQAKVTLVSLWLQELISREYLAGSTGKVAPPIISRIYQFVSDGMAGYNQARKVAYIPFPFPHAQITTLFVLVIVGFIPVLMLTFLNNEVYGFFWNFLTVMCFTGLHEVARELENPYQNVPNDIPLNHFQAQFNEGLMVMFYGYHPDAYWLLSKPTDEDDDGDALKPSPGAVATDKATLVENSSPKDDGEKASDDKVDDTRKSIERYETPLQMSSLEDSMLVGSTDVYAAPLHDGDDDDDDDGNDDDDDDDDGNNDNNKDQDSVITDQRNEKSDRSAIYAPHIDDKNVSEKSTTGNEKSLKKLHVAGPSLMEDNTTDHSQKDAEEDKTVSA